MNIDQKKLAEALRKALAENDVPAAAPEPEIDVSWENRGAAFSAALNLAAAQGVSGRAGTVAAAASLEAGQAEHPPATAG